MKLNILPDTIKENTPICFDLKKGKFKPVPSSCGCFCFNRTEDDSQEVIKETWRALSTAMSGHRLSFAQLGTQVSLNYSAYPTAKDYRLIFKIAESPRAKTQTIPSVSDNDSESSIKKSESEKKCEISCSSELRPYVVASQQVSSSISKNSLVDSLSEIRQTAGQFFAPLTSKELHVFQERVDLMIVSPLPNRAASSPLFLQDCSEESNLPNQVPSLN